MVLLAGQLVVGNFRVDGKVVGLEVILYEAPATEVRSTVEHAVENSRQDECESVPTRKIEYSKRREVERVNL